MKEHTTTYLTLKRAAQRLGVHEQTLRTWEKRGLIEMVRLPRSGYRRVPVTEIERLQEAMSTKPPASAGVRFAPPRQDDDSVVQAQALATVVRSELAQIESATSLDELMSNSRGRTWLP